MRRAKIAIVSLYVNDYRPMVAHLRSSSGSIERLASERLGEMVAIAEKELGADFEVIGTSGFTMDGGYRELSSPAKFDILLPAFEGISMPVFSETEDDLVKSRLAPERARQLCALLGVDMVAVIYSEWETKTGLCIRTTKPLVGTVLSIYDQTGEQIYANRKRTHGRTIGGFSAFDIDGALEEWMRGYERTLRFLVTRI